MQLSKRMVNISITLLPNMSTIVKIRNRNSCMSSCGLAQRTHHARPRNTKIWIKPGAPLSETDLLGTPSAIKSQLHGEIHTHFHFLLYVGTSAEKDRYLH